MKVQIELLDSSLNEMIEETIKGRILWLLRNEESLVQMIEEQIDSVIEKKVGSALISLSVEERIESKVREWTPSRQYLKQEAIKELTKRLSPIVKELKDAVKADISVHFVEEMKALKDEEESGKGG